MSDKGRLRVALERFLNSFPFGKFSADIVSFVRESDEAELVSLMQGLLDIYIEAFKDIPKIQQIFKDTKAKKHQVGAMLLQGAASSLGGIALSGISSPIVNKMNQSINYSTQWNILDPGIYTQLNLLGSLSDKEWDYYLKLHGLSPQQQLKYKNAIRKRLDVPDLLRYGLRYPEEQNYINDEIKLRGWDHFDLQYLQKMKYIWPSAQDWIRFAVREATDDIAATRLGLDGGNPGIAEREAEKSGLAPGMFKYYWRSHWELPSLGSANEFLHRLRPGRANVSFQLDDYSSLLQALDIAPKWHEYYRAVSYNPIGRVDLRRIYKTTDKDRQWLVDAYLDVGYNPNDADTLADWTIVDAEQSMRDVSLSKIQDAYRKGIMDKNEAIGMLRNLRYGERDIEVYITLWEYDLEQERVSAEIDYLKARYINAELSEAELRSALTQLGLTSQNVVIAVTNLNAQRKRQVTPLSVGDIKSLYENNIITLEQCLEELIARGYNQFNAKRLVQLIDVKAQKALTKELEIEQKETRAIMDNAASSEKQIALAKVSLQIAELNAETADIKRIYPDITDIDISERLNARLLEIKQLVAYLNIEKTKINLTYQQKVSELSNA